MSKSQREAGLLAWEDPEERWAVAGDGVLTPPQRTHGAQSLS